MVCESVGLLTPPSCFDQGLPNFQGMFGAILAVHSCAYFVNQPYPTMYVKLSFIETFLNTINELSFLVQNQHLEDGPQEKSLTFAQICNLNML